MGNVFIELISNIKSDFIAYEKHSRSKIKPFFKIHFYCNFNFRVSHFFYRIKLLPIARIFWLFNRIVFAIDIDPGAKLNGGFVIIHGIGIVIGRFVQSEGTFVIYHGATLGGNNGKVLIINDTLELKQPFIKDGVVIGINSCLLGPIIINENVVIGANAVVTKNIERDLIVIGNNKILNGDSKK